MKTELLYLEDTYLFESSAQFIEMRENEKGTAVILDKTIFYPQGGGQPTDTGYIKSMDAVFKVTFVWLDQDGVVWHFGELESGKFKEKEEVTLHVDAEKRKLHARIHSAGHIIDCAIQEMQVGIVPDKGFHFPQGPYIEGVGALEDTDFFKEELMERVNTIVLKDIPLIKENLSTSDAEQRGIHAPQGKSVRVVGFEGYSLCGCGGTHVASSGDIGTVTIRKVVSKKGRVKVSYSVI